MRRLFIILLPFAFCFHLYGQTPTIDRLKKAVLSASDPRQKLELLFQ
jgi:hypothetical protein